jgi:hypothetical protein
LEVGNNSLSFASETGLAITGYREGRHMNPWLQIFQWIEYSHTLKIL